jgi:hypothetical protein
VTPDNGGYMVAAYILAAVIAVAYTVFLMWRIRKLR